MHKNDIFARLSAKMDLQKVEGALKGLVDDGAIYTAIDSNTYMVL